MEPPVASNALDRRALAFTAAIAFSQDAVYALVFLSYMNHYLLDVLRASPGLPGYTLALYGGTKLVVHPLAGRLLDRTRPRLVYLAGVAAQCGAIALMLVVHTLGAFLAGAFLLAVGAAAVWPLIYDAVARTQAPDQRTRAMGVLVFFGYMAVGVGFASGIAMAGHIPWRYAFVLAGALVTGPALFHRSRALDPGGPRWADPHQAESAATTGHIALFGLVTLVDYAAVAALAGIYGPYVRLSLGITLPRAAMMLLPAGAMAVAGLLVAARVSRRERRPRELAVLFALSAAGAVLLSLTRDPWMAAAAALPLAAGVGGTGPIIAAAVIDLGRRRERGLIYGTLMSVEGIGSVLGPGIVAIAADLASPRAGFAVIGVQYVVLVAVVLAAASRFGPHGGEEGHQLVSIGTIPD